MRGTNVLPIRDKLHCISAICSHLILYGNALRGIGGDKKARFGVFGQHLGTKTNIRRDVREYAELFAHTHRGVARFGQFASGNYEERLGVRRKLFVGIEKT